MWQREKLTLIIFSRVLLTVQKGKGNTMSTTGISIGSFQTPQILSAPITVLKMTQRSTLERLKESNMPLAQKFFLRDVPCHHIARWIQFYLLFSRY